MRRIAVPAVLASVGLALLAACAELPRCPEATIQHISANDGSQLYVLDNLNMLRLAVMVRGLAEGTCRIVPPAERPADAREG